MGRECYPCMASVFPSLTLHVFCRCMYVCVCVCLNVVFIGQSADQCPREVFTHACKADNYINILISWSATIAQSV